MLTYLYIGLLKYVLAKYLNPDNLHSFYIIEWPSVVFFGYVNAMLSILSHLVWRAIFKWLPFITYILIFIPEPKMKQIVSNQVVKIPQGLTVHVKSRLVTVKGPRGVLKRSFKHLALDIRMVHPRVLRVEKWFGSKGELAAVRTVCSHIENMIKGWFYSVIKCSSFDCFHIASYCSL